MNILAIDTSTETLALCLQTQNTLLRITHKADFRHAEALAPWVDKMCSEASIKPAQLNLVIASLGPGSFTGLRIGIATAKGLAAGAGCSIIGVPTLDAIAWTHKYFCGVIVPVINAKKNRLYAAFYEKDTRISDFLDISAEELVKKTAVYNKILFTGPHAGDFLESAEQSYKNTEVHLDPDFSIINSYSLLQKGVILYTKSRDDKDIFPLYLRKSEAEISKENK